MKASTAILATLVLAARDASPHGLRGSENINHRDSEARRKPQQSLCLRVSEVRPAPCLAGRIDFHHGLLAGGPAETVNFDKAETGKAPTGWTATQTGTGQARWAVVADDTAPSRPNVLKQSGQATYPVCIKENTSIKDGSVEVKFKAISGREDQAGGLVWRAKDANNYYVARANALEDNVTIYHTINGRRTEKKRTSMKVTPNQWHTLRVDFQGNHFTVTFDGRKAIEWDDETFKDAGKVGVWTKADSVTVFDDFSFSGT